MRNKQIRIVIAVDGGCSIDALNFTDATVPKETQEIAGALGGHIDRQHDKPDVGIRQRCGQADREAAR